MEYQLTKEINFTIKVMDNIYLCCFYLLFDTIYYLKSEYKHYKTVFIY
jgi:hypothetical protein